MAVSILASRWCWGRQKMQWLLLLLLLLYTMEAVHFRSGAEDKVPWCLGRLRRKRFTNMWPWRTEGIGRTCSIVTPPSVLPSQSSGDRLIVSHRLRSLPQDQQDPGSDDSSVCSVDANAGCKQIRSDQLQLSLRGGDICICCVTDSSILFSIVLLNRSIIMRPANFQPS